MSLSGKQIQHIAAEVAKRLPGTSSGYPFTEHLQLWKIAGKVFLITSPARWWNSSWRTPMTSRNIRRR